MKLTYFAARGNCDQIRLLLADTNTTYQEIIVSGLEYERLKSTLLFGQLPQLGLFFYYFYLSEFFFRRRQFENKWRKCSHEICSKVRISSFVILEQFVERPVCVPELPKK